MLTLCGTPVFTSFGEFIILPIHCIYIQYKSRLSVIGQTRLVFGINAFAPVLPGNTQTALSLNLF